MSREYSISGSSAVASPTKTNLTVVSATTIRPAVYDILWGSTATPADNSLEWVLQRFTGAGTVTAVTPQALDPADPTATMTAGKNASVEPTYTANAIMIDVPLNQRASQRWVCAPGSEIKCPATGANGLGWQPIHASFTGNVTSTILARE